jgi:YD repeat-containing protein
VNIRTTTAGQLTRDDEGATISHERTDGPLTSVEQYGSLTRLVIGGRICWVHRDSRCQVTK